MINLRRTLQRLLRAPAFSLPALITLTLGIGGTSAAFTVVHGILLEPLPFDRAEQLVDITHTLTVNGVLRVDQSDASFLLYRQENHVFSDMAVYRAAQMNLGGAMSAGGASAERVSGAMASASLFTTLRVAAFRGRILLPSDEQPGAPPVVVLGQGLWERDWARDPSVVGRRVRVDGVEREVVGIMPAAFHFPDAGTSLWLPVTFDPARTHSASFDYRGIGRLKPGVPLAAASADLQRMLPRVPEVYPGRLTAGAITATHMSAEARPLRDVIVGDVGRVLWIVLGAVAVLLLVACANVANLFLARAEGRQRELAVRKALGAGRGVLYLEQVSEALLLSGLGGLLGVLGAAGAVRLLQQGGLGASIPRLADVRVDGTVLVVTAGLAALAAMCAAALPLLRPARSSLASLLGSSGAATSGGRARSRVRRGLVMAQVALALMLLSAAGLLARSYSRLRHVDPGFTAEGVVTFRVALPPAAYPGTSDAAAFVLRAQDSLLSLPGVQAVGVTSKLPLDPAGRQDSALFVEDRPLGMGQIPDLRPVVFVSPGYFRAMGIALHAGRDFAAVDPGADPARLPREVIVSEALARRYWEGSDPIGRRVKFNPQDPWSIVVGVVGSVHDVGLAQPPDEQIYSPLITQNVAGMAWMPRDLAFSVRTAGNTDDLARGAVRVAQAVDPSLPLYRVEPAVTLLSAAVARTTLTALLLAAAAILATAIGAAGIYGVAAYLVTLRTREIGVRIALGATAADVRRLVLAHVLGDACVGVAAGLLGAAGMSRVMRAVIFDVHPLDPTVLGAAAAFLLVAAVAAAVMPARRAVALDPLIAFRAD